MPKFPKDRRESMSLCYQVLAEDLNVLIEFMILAGLNEHDPGLLKELEGVAQTCRTKSKKLALRKVEEKEGIISVDFKKKDD
tara:strand:- start:141 stop:386 length:246 start_codon:yes stop_codon:yes gene_type:complete